MCLGWCHFNVEATSFARWQYRQFAIVITVCYFSATVNYVLQECFVVLQGEVNQVVYVKVDGIVFVEHGHRVLFIMVTVLQMVHLVSVLIHQLEVNVNQESIVLMGPRSHYLANQVYFTYLYLCIIKTNFDWFIGSSLRRMSQNPLSNVYSNYSLYYYRFLLLDTSFI